ncbi:MAG TPA: sugar phosphate isomerase/epimerase, partial [Bryobacteraceae bacterium]|nr:sugar phosphate isomerase/epimerase [Bryobacteraceae bacterium]
VRRQCAQDLPGTLTRVAELGYEGVELAGYYDRRPEELRDMLAERHLPVCAAHVPYESLLGGNLAPTIKFHQALGNRVLIVPGLPPNNMESIEAWLATAHRFNQITSELRGSGLRIGYHNHAIEFKTVNDKTPWEAFTGALSNDVTLELDLGNAGYGGADPISVLKQLPGRIGLVHVKDYTATRADLMIGEGDMNWSAFFSVCGSTPGPDWFVIEHDSESGADLRDIGECLTRFREKERGDARGDANVTSPAG